MIIVEIGSKVKNFLQNSNSNLLDLQIQVILRNSTKWNLILDGKVKRIPLIFPEKVCYVNLTIIYRNIQNIMDNDNGNVGYK